MNDPTPSSCVHEAVYRPLGAEEEKAEEEEEEEEEEVEEKQEQEGLGEEGKENKGDQRKHRGKRQRNHNDDSDDIESELTGTYEEDSIVLECTDSDSAGRTKSKYKIRYKNSWMADTVYQEYKKVDDKELDAEKKEISKKLKTRRNSNGALEVQVRWTLAWHAESDLKHCPLVVEKWKARMKRTRNVNKRDKNRPRKVPKRNKKK